MICPKCKRRIKFTTGKARKIHGVWHHKVCPTVRAAAASRKKQEASGQSVETRT
jgi:hypothetical protein